MKGWRELIPYTMVQNLGCSVEDEVSSNRSSLAHTWVGKLRESSLTRGTRACDVLLWREEQLDLVSPASVALSYFSIRTKVGGSAWTGGKQ